MYVIISFLIFLLCFSISFFTKNFKFLTVWNYFLAYVILNLVGRSIFIQYDLGTFDPWKSFLKGLNDESLTFGAFFYLYAIFFLCLGYMSIGNRLAISFWPKKNTSKYLSRNYVRTLYIRLSIYHNNI